jgi:hypothetical protein
MVSHLSLLAAGVAAGIGAIVVIGYCLIKRGSLGLQAENEEINYGSSGRNHTKINYGSSGHDHTKRQYGTQNEADRVISRMQRQGQDPNDTLNSYYNRRYGKWFVGNSSYR